MSFSVACALLVIYAIATQFANICAIIYFYNRNKKAGEFAFLGLLGNPLVFSILFIPTLRSEVAAYIGKNAALGLLAWHCVFVFVSFTVAFLFIWRSTKFFRNSRSE